MALLRQTETSRRDLVAQWVWYAENGSVELADEFLQSVQQSLEVLAMHPELGACINSRHPKLQGIRRIAAAGKFRKVLLFYRSTEGEIVLLRVIRGERNLARVLTESLM